MKFGLSYFIYLPSTGFSKFALLKIIINYFKLKLKQKLKSISHFRKYETFDIIYCIYLNK